MQAVLIEELERRVVRAPKGEVFEAVLLVFQNLLLELPHMVFAPVIRHAPDPQPLHHRRPIRGRAVLGIEGHDAPGDEVLPREEDLGGVRRQVGGRS